MVNNALQESPDETEPTGAGVWVRSPKELKQVVKDVDEVSCVRVFSFLTWLARV